MNFNKYITLMQDVNNSKNCIEAGKKENGKTLYFLFLKVLFI